MFGAWTSRNRNLSFSVEILAFCIKRLLFFVDNRKILAAAIIWFVWKKFSDCSANTSRLGNAVKSNEFLPALFNEGNASFKSGGRDKNAIEQENNADYDIESKEQRDKGVVTISLGLKLDG